MRRAHICTKSAVLIVHVVALAMFKLLFASEARSMRAVVARARLKEAVVWCRLLRYVRSFCRKSKQASYLVESTQMRELGR